MCERLARKLDRKSPAPGTRLVVGPGKSRNRCYRCPNGAGEDNETRRLVDLAWEEGIGLGSGPSESVRKFGKLIVHFEEAFSLSQAQAKI